MIMHPARYEAMDAQRFDPMRAKKTPSHLPFIRTEKDMGQFLRRVSQPELPPNDVVAGIWSDHELVLVPLDVASHRNSISSALANSALSSSTSSSTSDSTAPTSSSATFFSTSPPSPTPEDAREHTSPSGSPTTRPRRVDTSDREDLIVTRTIVRPSTQSTLRGMFSRPATPFSRPTSPLSRPNTPAFHTLNCFRPSAFEGDVGGTQTERGTVTTQPVFQVIVTQTREQYEQDLAFKEAVQEVYPEAGRCRRAAH